MCPHFHEITLAPVVVCATLQSNHLSWGVKTIGHSSATLLMPLFSCDVKTSDFHTDKPPVVATARFINLYPQQGVSCGAADRAVSQTHPGQRWRRLSCCLPLKQFRRIHWQPSMEVRRRWTGRQSQPLLFGVDPPVVPFVSLCFRIGFGAEVTRSGLWRSTSNTTWGNGTVW